MSERIKNPKAHAAAMRRAREIHRAMAVVAREQTRKMLKQAERVVGGKGKPSDIKPSHEKELKSAAKHAMVEAFKAGRKVAEKKIEAGRRRAPKSAGVRELDPVERIVASVRELDADVLQYAEVAAEYEKWADNLIGGTLRDTVTKARQVVADGIREGVPWNDYGWDKELGRNTKEGLKSQLSTIFGGYEDWQLFRVSVTEHTRAVGLGNLYEYDRDEMVVGGRWVVDYKGCEICTPRDGQVFTTAVLRQIHPGHPNCQCDIDPVFKWETDSVQDEAPGEPVPPEPKPKAAKQPASVSVGQPGSASQKTEQLRRQLEAATQARIDAQSRLAERRASLDRLKAELAAAQAAGGKRAKELAGMRARIAALEKETKRIDRMLARQDRRSAHP